MEQTQDKGAPSNSHQPNTYRSGGTDKPGERGTFDPYGHLTAIDPESSQGGIGDFKKEGR